MDEGFENAAGIGSVPLEESEVKADGVVESDVEDLTTGAAEHRRGLVVDFGEEGESGRLWIVDCGLGREEEDCGSWIGDCGSWIGDAGGVPAFRDGSGR